MPWDTGMDQAAMVLVLVGALNWGLVGVGNVNLVKKLLGGAPALEHAVYALVGLAALHLLRRAALTEPEALVRVAPG